MTTSIFASTTTTKKLHENRFRQRKKHVESCCSCEHDTPRTRRGSSLLTTRQELRRSSFLRFDNAKTRRGLYAEVVVRAITTRQDHPRFKIASRQRQNTQRVVARAIATPRTHAEGPRFCVSTTRKHAEGCRSRYDDTPKPRRSFLRFDNAKTRRGLSFALSRHAKTTQIVFAFRQCQNTQRVVVRAITTRQNHADRFCVSTTPKHAEGCRLRYHDTPKPRRSFLRFDNAKTHRGLSSALSRHAKTTQIVFAFRQRQNTQRVVVCAITTRQNHAERFCVSTTPKHAEGCPRYAKTTLRVLVFAFRQRQNTQKVSGFALFVTKCAGSRKPYPVL